VACVETTCTESKGRGRHSGLMVPCMPVSVATGWLNRWETSSMRAHSGVSGEQEREGASGVFQCFRSRNQIQEFFGNLVLALNTDLHLQFFQGLIDIALCCFHGLKSHPILASQALCHGAIQGCECVLVDKLGEKLSSRQHRADGASRSDRPTATR